MDDDGLDSSVGALGWWFKAIGSQLLDLGSTVRNFLISFFLHNLWLKVIKCTCCLFSLTCAHIRLV